MEKGGQNYFYHSDHLGSIRKITDDSGNIATSYEYDSFGNPTTTGNITSPYSFTGREYDPESSLYYYRARYYNPQTGRFISQDPIGFDSGDINLYRYVNNSPLNYTDPSGNVICGGLCVAIVGGIVAIWNVLDTVNDISDTVDVFNDSCSTIGDKTGAVILLGAGIVDPTPSNLGKKAGKGIGGVVKKLPNGVGNTPNKAPNFIVSPNGTAFPVPKGSSGPTPVVNQSGKTTGIAFTGGKGGANGQVDTIRLMDPTPPRGRSPGYPNGYIKYENKVGQGVDSYTGRTIPNSQSHYPIE